MQSIKQIIILIVVLLLTTPPVSAGLPDVDIVALLPSLIAQGFDQILIGMGNQFYSSIGATNSTNATEMLTNSFITPNNFLENEQLQKTKDFNAFWFAFFWIAFVMLGGCYLMIHKASPPSGFTEDKGFGSTYIEVTINGLLLYGLYLYGLDAVFKFETALSWGITLEAMDMVAGMPTTPFLHLLLACMFFLVNCFFILRYLILVILSTYFLFLVAMSKIPVIGSIIYVIFLYGITFLFIRPIIALVLLAGSGAIASIPVGYGVDILAYVILLLLVLGIAILVMIAPFLYLWIKAMMPIKILRMRT